MTTHRGSRWLSEAAETLVQEIEAGAPEAIHCEVLIVGSGYGGAVAAARLAGARPRGGGDPVSVFVLERGQEYLPGMFPATFAELPGHVRFSLQDGLPARGKREGVFDLRLGGDVNVLLGNGLGGGSLINAAVMERPSADAFADSRWPEGIDLEALADPYSKAERMLDPREMPGTVPKLDSLYAAAVAMGAQASRKAKVAVTFAEKGGTTPAGVAMHECLKCGDCVSGCNHQAKQSLDVNYLALARANGARLYCGATVQRVRRRDDGYAVEFHFTEPSKARSDRKPYVVHARRVVLAAGTLGSTEILLRSQGPQLPIASKALGCRFSGNGDLIAVAHRQTDAALCSAREGDPPKTRNVGPTITGIVRYQPQDGSTRPLVFEEFAIPGPLRRLFGEAVATTSALHGLTQTDRSQHAPTECIDDPLAVSDAALTHTLVYGAMGDDGALGRIELATTAARDAAPTDGAVRIKWDHAGQASVFKAQMAALRHAHERVGGRGGRVLPNPMWEPLPPFKVFVDLDQTINLHGPPTTVHPLGGCPMADDKEHGVVDSLGRVYAEAGDKPLPGLAVLDGSIVPAALGINPALTIAALAERAVPVLADDWKLELRTSDAMQTVPRPVRRDLTKPDAPRPTTITLQERMTGRLVIDTRTFDAEAVVDFAPVDVATLRSLPRVIPQPKVALRFTDASGVATWAKAEGEAAVLVRERSSLVTRLARSVDLARRKLQPAARRTDDCSWMEFAALCSHLGQVRLIRYDWTIVAAHDDAPVKRGQKLRLTKRVEFTENGNPWRQLSEGRLDCVDTCTVELGRLVLDPAFFVEQLQPLLRVDAQQDQPNAIGDIVELGLWVLRIVLRIHLLNFLPPFGTASKAQGRLPGQVDGIDPDKIELVLQPGPARARDQGPAKLRLSRYAPRSPKKHARPVLLIHGYGAGGSTFAHPSIGVNLVEALSVAGREVWVLDMRTSIGLEQRHYWSFDEIANEDIPLAIHTVLARSAAPADGKVDVVAHCIGAAMFSVAVLSSRDLHHKVGVVVLSQVGPLLRMSAVNRFRGFVASYLRQYLSATEFDVQLPEGELTTLLIDALLATFPYPDDDRETERLKTVPGFSAVRHRADAIFGQTMQLENISDRTLLALDAIYGWVMVEGLAQTIHYAREQLLTDSQGMNQVVSFETIAERFGFPLLMVHGRKNALFDWRGSYDTIRLLTRIFDDVKLPPEPPPENPIGADRPRRLHVFDDYGHQDTLIGKDAHRDVFPTIVGFLEKFAHRKPSQATEEPPLRIELPWIGPLLGRVARQKDDLVCRLALRPSPARASALAIVYVPAHRGQDGKWCFEFKEAVIALTTREELIDKAVSVRLILEQVPRYDGFAVITVHNDLPKPRVLEVDDTRRVHALFASPSTEPPSDVLLAVEQRLTTASADVADLTVVELDPAWTKAAEAPMQPAQASLCFAIASCQYPPGLVDRGPAQRSHERLADYVAQSPLDKRPQLLLLTGDQVYLDSTAGLFDPGGADNVDRAYQLNFTLPALRRVTKALPTYPLLDDHEVEDNWEPEKALTDPHDAALRGYRRYQHKLVDDRQAPPFDYTLAPAGFPFFVLDARSTRERRVLRTTPQATLLDDASIHAPNALDELCRWLEAAPRDAPKFIVSSVPVFPFPRAALAHGSAERLALDDWSGYPRSQFALLEFIRDKQIGNVVLLSGDRHMSSVSSLWIEGHGAPLEVVSIVSSGLHAPWPFANSRADELWLDGPVKLRHAGQEICGTVVTAAAGASDGFAIVRVERSEAGQWRIDIRLDLADGVRRYRRTLDDADDRRWSVA